jgi:queuine tRNA-ribosyltransferase
MTPQDLRDTKTQVVIANTYHLWQRLGENLNTYQGIHKEMGWDGPMMTDSGGFQVFSLGSGRSHGVSKSAKKKRKKEKSLVRITESGVFFTTERGEQFLGPKESIQIQEKLGADIILAFDECTSPLHTYDYTVRALERTHRWEKICLETKARDDQELYGIVQGGGYRNLREESAKYIGSLPFDGFAIGGSFGSSYGGAKQDLLKALDWTIPLLPKEKPRHLLGIGKIEDLFEGVERGVDTFDCVIPTREGRHGRIWTKKGPKKFKSDSPDNREAAIHNVSFFNTLMKEIRTAIEKDEFEKLKHEYLNY